MRTLSLAISIFCGLSCLSPAQTSPPRAAAAPTPAAPSSDAQTPSDVFDKAPPAIDDALRERVSAFYQAHVDGKFRQADEYVAEDSKDAFFVADKPHYKGFQITKITYSDNYTKATVITACKTDMFFHGRTLPVTMPALTHWKIDNGQWFWSYVTPTAEETPWGVMKPGPPGDPGSGASRIPADPAAAARSILSRVMVDGDTVNVDQTRPSKAEIHLKNGLLGPIKVFADPTGTPGLTVRPVKPEVESGGETAIVIEFNPDDPTIVCRDCLMHPGVRPPVTVNLTVKPTQQRFPIKIIFLQPAAPK